MPRNMSFAMTTGQVRAKTKTVTRRFGWYFLKPGDLIQPVEKAMGLKKGEKIVKIGGFIRVVSVRRELLMAMAAAECAREGFPDMTPGDFIEMLCRASGVTPETPVNRIEFEYV